KFGAGVRQEVVGELMNQTYYEALSQQSLRPAGQPRIEPTQMKEGQDLEFTAIFEVYPEIALPDFSKIKADRLQAEITETYIVEMVETLRKQRQTWVEVKRAAASGDLVNIDYCGKLDGEEFEGGSAKGAKLVLGSERMIPGFEEGIEGQEPGAKFTLNLQFPGEYHNQELAGKEVAFELTLNKVQEQTLPEVDEEFFASFGVDEGGLEAFREEVANNMKRELKSASRNKLKNRIMDQLIEQVRVDAPAALVASEIAQLRQQAMQQMGGQKIDPAMLPDELFNEQAERRVKLGLILGEVIQQQNIQADPARVRESVEELASTYESPEEVIKWYYGNKEQLASIESTVVEDQVFDFVIEQATVSEKQLSYQDVIKPEPREESGVEQPEAG
ncbi:MAG: trigger factor, partial [Gammaproteobacteria bacterium]